MSTPHDYNYSDILLSDFRLTNDNLQSIQQYLSSPLAQHHARISEQPEAGTCTGGGGTLTLYTHAIALHIQQLPCLPHSLLMLLILH
jgi:hypothetical protein